MIQTGLWQVGMEVDCAKQAAGHRGRWLRPGVWLAFRQCTAEMHSVSLLSVVAMLASILSRAMPAGVRSNQAAVMSSPAFCTLVTGSESRCRTALERPSSVTTPQDHLKRPLEEEQHATLSWSVLRPASQSSLVRATRPLIHRLETALNPKPCMVPSHHSRLWGRTACLGITRSRGERTRDVGEGLDGQGGGQEGGLLDGGHAEAGADQERVQVVDEVDAAHHAAVHERQGGVRRLLA